MRLLKFIEIVKVPVTGVLVATIALAIGALASPSAHPMACTDGACTYYTGGTGYGGSCGTNNSGCVCSYNGNSQGQAACKVAQ